MMLAFLLTRSRKGWGEEEEVFAPALFERSKVMYTSIAFSLKKLLFIIERDRIAKEPFISGVETACHVCNEH